MANEVAAARERMWRLAEDTGGFVTVGNNLDGAFARIEQHAGFHYSIAYYPRNTRRDGKYRRIEVKVSAPDAKVVARRGYLASTDRPIRVRASAVSPVLRDALDATFPLDGLRLAITAAPFRGNGRDASVALVHEAPGLDATELDVATMAIDEQGSTKATDAKKLQWPAGSAAGARVRENGFRWLSRLTLKPGRYQFRVAGVAGVRRGSVYLDLDVPDFSDGDLALSGVLLSSAAAFDTPTHKPDPLLADALPGPPTTSRAFASGDIVGVFCEIYDNGRNRSAPVEITVAVDAADGRRLFARSETRQAGEAAATRGVLKFRTGFTVPSVPGGDYLVVIAAGRPGASEQTAVRKVPFRVIAD